MLLIKTRVIQMLNKHLEKRIDNSMTALENSRKNNCKWAIQYWSNVLGYLMRQMRRSVDIDNKR